jgi:hypothetical protein
VDKESTTGAREREVLYYDKLTFVDLFSMVLHPC